VHQILVIEDNYDLAEITRIHLEMAGYGTSIAHSCSDAFSLLQSNAFDLILLDVLLPDSRGDLMCKKIRETESCPIIFMSCLDNSSTIVSALGSGGDDYVVKPIKYDELLARISSNIRRYHQYREQNKLKDAGHLLRFKHFEIDTLRHKVFIKGDELDLSTIEHSILRYMTEHPDTLLLYDDIYHNVWGHDSLGDIRTVMVHISNLRKKIDPDKSGIIETVRSAGYIFSDI
jgi:DNA-binding response OmpR family regulator